MPRVLTLVPKLTYLSVTDVSFTTPTTASSRSGTARVRSREATRERLRSSATELFSRKGVRGVTTHDIADAAGVAAGTFYLHFKDKHELFRQLVLEALEELRARLDKVAKLSSPPAQAVRRQAEEMVGYAEESRHIIRLLFSHDTESAELQSFVLNSFAEFAEAQMRAQQAMGTFKKQLDPAVTAQAMTGMIARVIDWWTQDPSRASRETIIDTLCDLQLSGTLPTKAAG